MTEREIYEKHDNLCDIAEAKKKKKKKNIDGFRKKLMIPNYEISKCPEHKVKSKIGNIFADEKILEQYCYDLQNRSLFLWALQRTNKSWQKWS